MLVYIDSSASCHLTCACTTPSNSVSHNALSSVSTVASQAQNAQQYTTNQFWWWVTGKLCVVFWSFLLLFCSNPSHREHPIGDKNFQCYIRQQSECSTYSVWSRPAVAIVLWTLADLVFHLPRERGAPQGSWKRNLRVWGHGTCVEV